MKEGADGRLVKDLVQDLVKALCFTSVEKRGQHGSETSHGAPSSALDSSAAQVACACESFPRAVKVREMINQSSSYILPLPGRTTRGSTASQRSTTLAIIQREALDSK